MYRRESDSNAICMCHSKEDSVRSCYTASSSQTVKPLWFEQGLEGLSHSECHIQLPDAPQWCLCFSRASWEGIRKKSSVITVIHAYTEKGEWPLHLEVKDPLNSTGEEVAMKNTGKAVNKSCFGATANQPASSTGHTGLWGHDPHTTASGWDQTQK